MIKYNRIIFLNQMAGPLFRQLCEGVVDFFPNGGVLYTGHPDTLNLRGTINPNLNVICSPTYVKKTFISRIWSWVKYIVFVSKVLFRAKKNEVFIITSNPPLLAMWVRIFCIIKSVDYIYLVYDIYPDILEKLKFIREKGIISKIWNKLNYYVNKRALRVVTISNSMAKRLNNYNSIDGLKVDVVYPWADTEFIKPLHRNSNPFSDKFIQGNGLVILYSGNIGETHDIESILKVVHYLKNDNRFKFVFIGDGAKGQLIKSYINQSGNLNITLFPFQDEKMLPYTLTLADVSLVLIENGMEDLIIPSKLFSYLAAGSAIIGISEKESDLNDIINKANCGYVFNPFSTEQIAKTLIELYTNTEKLSELKLKSRIAAENLFSQKKGIMDFNNILKELNVIC
jgi:glycosyltransferase involved in cell wall biosynthesis